MRSLEMQAYPSRPLHMLLAPDGYNIFLCALTNQAIAGHLYPKATPDITRDFEPVALLANGAHALDVRQLKRAFAVMLYLLAAYMFCKAVPT